MAEQVNWQKILIQCKNNIQKQITPLLKTLNQPQPNLGIGAGGDPIKQIDLAAEEAIINTLKGHKISFTLISEESGVKMYGGTPNENFVTADPMDGTTNLERGIPFYATSIAVSAKPALNAIHTSLVADLPHDITYMAQKGKGAYRNNQKITPSKNTSLEEAVIGIDLNTYRVQEIAPKLSNIIQKTKHIRHLGANALELCYVADGTTDAFLDIRGKLRATDIAAAWLILKEASAKITTPEGKPLSIKLDPKQKVTFIASANQKLHKIILNFLRREKE
ncbi:MAG: inositol monophosphatase family protein [Candidatus Bathyarchaeota archaeon]|jgi:myo-inositol-1(or 4)-monophosphatase|nr:inositol monophosphatase family protein [Candidatus Bathyarchaeota archaeon]